MIVSNPPYISASDFEELEPLVREQEPKMALFAEEEGYAFYRRIASQAGKYLKPNGALVLEIGDMQAEKVCKLLWDAGFVEVESGCDLAGRPRWVSAYPAVGAR
ncbi:Release factor glutamine methyltransferase [bioreactor metagenome]|uniref:Release factor glutamine methyltransferase n=1 Tax=bioreactor metagenome TaxID=1076179 RepID=A0A645K1I0_9ZZZZ